MSSAVLRRLLAACATLVVAAGAASQTAAPAAHWAYRPLAVVAERLDIDASVAARLGALGVEPAARADRAGLVRRLYLTLHGLPPTPEELVAVVRSPEPDWYQRLVDRLLRSPRYGERMAQHWLDLVRFAETHGFETNTPRPRAWHYRDWVIDALNRDLPYDRFVAAQIAGDQHGEDAATGFLVAGPWDEVKSPDPRLTAEQRSNELADMVGVTGTTFLATTVGCARCHDHKFDPIRQVEFYALEAVFAGVMHGERELQPADAPRRRARVTALEGQRVELVAALAAHEPRAGVGEVLLLDDEDLAVVEVLAPLAGHGDNPAGSRPGQRDDPGEADRLPNISRGRYSWWRHDGTARDVIAYRPGRSGAHRLWVSWGAGYQTHCTDAVWLLDDDGDLGTRDDQRQLAVVDQQRMARPDDGALPGEPRWSGLRDLGVVKLRSASRLVLRGGTTGSALTADVVVLEPAGGGELPDVRTAVRAGGNVERFAPQPATALRFTVAATLGGAEPCIDELRVFSAGRNVAAADAGAVASASSEYPGNVRHKIVHANDGRVGNDFSWISGEPGGGWLQIDFPGAVVVDRVEWARDVTGRYSDRLPLRYRIEIRTPAGTWQQVAADADRLPPQAFGGPVPRFLRCRLGASGAVVQERLDELERELAGLRSLPRGYLGRFQTPPPTHRLHRGDVMSPAERVAPGMPALFGAVQLPLDADESARRLALAEWLTTTARDLLARVIVNRVWQQHFGIGFVATPNDFGRNGAAPSHPELLDALAAELIADGWSLRRLHRRIVMSATWQQASLGEARGAEVDAAGRLLWRFPARRLDAEAIRDAMLCASGELDLSMGGVGFDVFEPNSNYVRVYTPRQDFGPDAMRRAIYTRRIRMERDPTFGVFDCPDGARSIPRRIRSTTALQAFSLLNSPFVIQRAEAFARRLRSERPGDPEAQVARAFALVYQRDADSEERAAAGRLVAKHGLAALCRALFNTGEFVFLP